MPHHVEGRFPLDVARLPERGELPHQVVKLNALSPLLPEAGPSGQIDVEEVEAVSLRDIHASLYPIPIVRSRDDPDVPEPGEKARPHPSGARL
jgi:hypothetical protein